MAASTTLTVRLDPKLKKQLGVLGKKTKRSSSFLASQAIAGYVAWEMDFIRKVEEAQKSLRAGHGIPHEEVMREMEEIIAKARKKQSH